MCLNDFNSRVFIIFEQDIIDESPVVGPTRNGVTFRIADDRKFIGQYGECDSSVAPSVRIVQIAGEETGFMDKVGFIDQCTCALGSFCIVQVEVGSHECEFLEIHPYCATSFIACQRDNLFLYYFQIFFKE